MTENYHTSDTNNTHDFNYEFDYYESINHNMDSPTCTHPACVFLVTVDVIIFILGFAGNAVVIWIAGFKMKKSVTRTWYLSLAVSNFLFCCTLPFTVVYRIREDWIFGLFMCKFIPFIVSLNMFSSIFLLVIISVDQCVLVMFPVWAQNQRSIRKASVIVTLVWIISAVLSTPSLIFQEVHRIHGQTQFCFNSYMSHENLTAVVVCRFVFGFLIPFLIIIICYIMKINQSVRFKKPFKIMTALTVTYFICWLPFHTYGFIEVNFMNYEINTVLVAHVLGISLASAYSCLNPFIYAIMGRDVEIKWYRFLSKIENALVGENEDQNTQQWLPLKEENI
ncbi:chemerin-like receptor 1 [Astyanax mexicanus]|uniref:chemerin-like receptor 1 n=1 Tax=Astyanax mexicanus TaxID=7994 RepID=UPI0020CAA771|nr:chemerin-like receptor 1 [Astyanax mexicanus]